MKKKLFDFLKITFFLSLGVFFIWLFMHNLTSEEKKDIYSSFLSANYLWVILSVIIGVFSHLSRAIRWKLLLKPMGYNPSLKNTFMAVMIGYFANLALPRQLVWRKQQLLDRILKEQLNDFRFSDLFAERVVLLLRFTTPRPKDVIQWVQTIIKAQLADGTWGNYSAQLSYDGQSVTGKIGPSHTIALALQTLRIFLNMPETYLAEKLITRKNKDPNLNHHLPEIIG